MSIEITLNYLLNEVMITGKLPYKVLNRSYQSNYESITKTLNELKTTIKTIQHSKDLCDLNFRLIKTCRAVTKLSDTNSGQTWFHKNRLTTCDNSEKIIEKSFNKVINQDPVDPERVKFMKDVKSGYHEWLEVHKNLITFTHKLYTRYIPWFDFNAEVERTEETLDKFINDFIDSVDEVLEELQQINVYYNTLALANQNLSDKHQEMRKFLNEGESLNYW